MNYTSRLILVFSFVILSISCQKQYDQTDPIATLTAYINLNNQGNFGKAYQLLSDSSKLRVTKHEFILAQQNNRHFSADSIYMIFMDPLKPNFRSYDVEKTVLGEKRVTNIVVSKEEEVWKVLWLETLIDSEISRLVETRKNYSTRNLLALRLINPICRKCNELIAWHYIENDDVNNAKYYFRKAEEISPNTINPLLATLFYSLNGDSLLAPNWSNKSLSEEGSGKYLTEVRFLEIIDELLEKGYVTLSRNLIEVAVLSYPESFNILEKKAVIYHKLVLNYVAKKPEKSYLRPSSDEYQKERYRAAIYSLFDDPRILQRDSADHLEFLKYVFQEVAVPYIKDKGNHINKQEEEAYQKAFLDKYFWYNYDRSSEKDTLELLVSTLQKLKE